MVFVNDRCIQYFVVHIMNVYIGRKNRYQIHISKINFKVVEIFPGKKFKVKVRQKIQH